MSQPKQLVSDSSIEGLLANVCDPERVVRIASMRAVLRIAGIMEQVSPIRELMSARAEGMILDELRSEVRNYREEDITGKSFLPTREMRREFDEILDPYPLVDQEDAHVLADSIAEKIESIATQEARSEGERAANRRLAEIIRTPLEGRVYLGGNDFSEALQMANPKLSTQLIASLFARLALPAYEDSLQNHLRISEAQKFSSIAKELGPRFRPDVPALFRVYRSFFRGSIEFWWGWLGYLREKGVNPAEIMPAWFPLDQGQYFAITRQLEWVVSRPELSVLLDGLKDAVGSESVRDRWAAAQLIEGSVRYVGSWKYPEFAGGSGPEDVLPPRLQWTPPPKALPGH